MADRLDAVNASFEDCEEQDEDVDVMLLRGILFTKDKPVFI